MTMPTGRLLQFLTPGLAAVALIALGNGARASHRRTAECHSRLLPLRFHVEMLGRHAGRQRRPGLLAEKRRQPVCRLQDGSERDDPLHRPKPLRHQRRLLPSPRRPNTRRPLRRRLCRRHRNPPPRLPPRRKRRPSPPRRHQPSRNLLNLRNWRRQPRPLSLRRRRSRRQRQRRHRRPTRLTRRW